MDQAEERHEMADAAIVRFFDGDQEISEEEFLARHPEPTITESVAALRSQYTSDRCTCHGKPTEFHVEGVSEGSITFTIDWCEEAFQRNAKAWRLRRVSEELAKLSDPNAISDARFVGRWALSTGVTWTLNSDGTGVSERPSEIVCFRWSVQDNQLTLSGSRPTENYQVVSIEQDRIVAKVDGLNFVWLRQ